MIVRNILKAGSFTASLAWRHLRAEPGRAPLLAYRLLRGPVRRGARSVSGRFGTLPRAYALWDAGHRAQALAMVRRAAAGAPPRRLARLAAFAIAVEQPALARELVGRLPKGPRSGELAHRLAVKTGRAVATEPPRSAPRPLGTGSGPAAPRVGPVPNRVLHLVTNALPHTNAGYTQRTHRIAMGQRAIGLDPHVLTRIGYPLTGGVPDARRRVDVDGIAYHRSLPWVAPAGPERELRVALRLADTLVRTLRPALLHAASNHRNAELALLLGRRHGIPVVYEVRGFLEESWLSRDPGRNTSDAFYLTERERETECMLAADMVVTLGEAMRSEIAARGVNPEKIIIVPNAVDDTFRAPLPDGRPVRDEFAIAPEDFVVGTTTSCYSYEGLDTLISAVAALRDRGMPAHALIVGDGPELAALRRQALDLGLISDAAQTAGTAGDRVHLPGRVPADQVRRYHAAFDVFAVPRRDERVCRLVTPLKPVEAMAGGLPVVASDLTALREIVEPGVTGELIPPDDPLALANCLEQVFYSHSSRAKLGGAARERIGVDRTWRGAAETYAATYMSLWGGLSGPGQERTERPHGS